MLSTAPFTSLFPSLVFVCPSNCGSAIFMLMIAVNPSLTSFPVIVRSLLLWPYSFVSNYLSALVIALLNPVRCVPPSIVLMLFTKLCKVFTIRMIVLHCNVYYMSSVSDITLTTSCNGCFPSLIYSTNFCIPPSYMYSSVLPGSFIS
jgi:hypothetical protein